MAQIRDSILLHQDVGPAQIDTLPSDTVMRDTTYVFLLDAETLPELPEHDAPQSVGLSWIIAGLLFLFMIVAIRFRKNSKFLAGVLRDATDTRERGNVFDDTVRETSFMVILNLLWCVCSGIMLYVAMGFLSGKIVGLPETANFSESMSGSSIIPLLICIGAMFAYQGIMSLLYAIVGNVFSDKLHTRMLLHGFWAVTGLSTLLFFPIALMSICYPADAGIAPGIAGITLILMKILIIRKGFRIFFTQISTWVLFIYYLCSLEVVPLIMLYAGTLELIRIFG